ncbi:MAG: peptidylprolyl isomerase [Parcubacteria group bacterium Gr01-1014_13]|nr:MAG: peptidylprolyl isomerase [Parcubacteria group bacterium Gr01-1014_13]
MKKAFIFLLVVAVLVGGAYLYRKQKAASPQPATETTSTQTSQPTSTDMNVTAPNSTSTTSTVDNTPKSKLNMDLSIYKIPIMIIDQKKTYTAKMKTTAGEMEIALNASMTPETVNNFVFLSKKNFYDNTIFHRVIKGFMIQGGDPEGTGKGGPGYKFNDEPFTGEYLRGTLAMANSGPNTNGSQFFIMHDDYPLPPNYVIFGKVTKGLDVVDKIAMAQVTMSSSGENSKPVNPVKILSIEIVEK